MRKICIALAAAFLLQLALAPLASVYAAPAPLGEDAITSKAAILVDAAPCFLKKMPTRPYRWRVSPKS